jgi:hypothetical protein
LTEEILEWYEALQSREAENMCVHVGLSPDLATIGAYVRRTEDVCQRDGQQNGNRNSSRLIDGYHFEAVRNSSEPDGLVASRAIG